MYTQCPECSTAFRVTAKVLQQAGGRVRCGGCGHAFSALEHLTEEMPGSKVEQPVAATKADDDLTSEEKFRETSNQLLQTLSELTGNDEIRIEDTGVEWHVVDEEEEGIAAEAAPEEDATSLDALVENDDSSGDFLELEEHDESGEPELSLADDEATDLAASEGAAWSEHNDADEDDAADDIPLEVEEELAAIHSELSSIEDKEEPRPDDLDSQFEIQAEAMGLDTSGSYTVTEHNREENEDEEASTDDAGEDEEHIAAAFTPDAEVIELSLANSEAQPAHEPEYSRSDVLPEQSEEELTINQEIDQELLAIAGTDEHLRATIVGLEQAEKAFDEDAPGVETIIMEGDQIRGAFQREKERLKREAALKRFDKAGNLIDSYVARRVVRGGRRSTDPVSFGMIAGVALLVLSLFAQIIHANRQSLSTSALFNKTVGNVYRMLGNPITPEWSIKGWQFEATNGSIANEEDVLTIYSRIGNRSQLPLPYPLVHVSLTDRWEDIIGSAILEPSQYLAADANPNQPVVPGNNFTAVITIDEPSVDATGFKLNVCYRVSPGRVRCATEDFKD